ncbi:uncharacterized protein CANTADRAFT_25501 [Suhomyces tanzawaensis NRRL Y-17324]|uniref:HIG1 domain-containing protein n=1 Tax=Suhomyces tanzawaensis NRRL Y-17324 TaxID=984487 RepID=A0A1E4SP88_9ASCO|nr:uncharacterized protein CANTADRAFT_25501 [Suhomyces tanzawaensis NRRL Y-17324]ODV81315.1 hypothetical protein CANTADRAFT_25501 [Suhomyces tanzawaensis NRRL Y-17324]
MKILSDEERNAHWNAVLYEGTKGLIIGIGFSYGLVTYIKKKNPILYKRMSASTKAATWAVPSIGISAFWADEGSVKFDEETYRSDYLQKQKEEMEAKLQQMSTSDRVMHHLNDNKYKIIVGSWAASLYGSWRYVNRDPFMNTQQKLVQARVYAQALTVVLLLSTIVLSMKEAEMKKKEPKPVPEWKRYLDEQEAIKKSQ